MLLSLELFIHGLYSKSKIDLLMYSPVSEIEIGAATLTLIDNFVSSSSVSLYLLKIYAYLNPKSHQNNKIMIKKIEVILILKLRKGHNLLIFNICVCSRR